MRPNPRTKKPVTVAILGPFGWGNLGDAAIQEAVLSQLGSRRPDARFIGISLVPTDTQNRHGIETYAYDTGAFIYRRSSSSTGHTPVRRNSSAQQGANAAHGWRKLIGQAIGLMYLRTAGFLRPAYDVAHVLYIVGVLRKVDLLLVSGGGQLDELWGGAWHHPYTLFKWTTLARLTRTKIAFLSVGAGIVESRLSRFFLRRALRLAHYRSYRDAGSKEIVCNQLSSGFDDPVVPDMAFALPAVRLHVQAPRASESRTVAIGPMAYCHPTLWPRPDRVVYDRYVSVLTELCQALLDQGVRVRFFVGEVVQDLPVIEDVRRRLIERISTLSSDQIQVPRIEDVNDLLSCLSDVDMVVASRFHGVLLALLLRRPVLAFSYERKVRQLMRDLGQETLCTDIGDSDVAELVDLIADIQVRKELISRELDSRVRRETDAVMEQFDWISRSLLPNSTSSDQAAA